MVDCNRPLLSFTAKNTNICLIYAATGGSVTAFYTGPPEVTVILLGVLCTKKRWLLPQPIWKWGTKKRLATTAVYYVTRGGRNGAKSLLWTTPDWLRSEGDTVGIAMVGESKLAKHRNWSKKFLLSAHRVSNCQLMTQVKETSCSYCPGD